MTRETVKYGQYLAAVGIVAVIVLSVTVLGITLGEFSCSGRRPLQPVHIQGGTPDGTT